MIVLRLARARDAATSIQTVNLLVQLNLSTAGAAICAPLVLTEPLDLDRAAEARILESDRWCKIVQKRLLFIKKAFFLDAMFRRQQHQAGLNIVVIHQPLSTVQFRWRKLIIEAKNRHYKEKVVKQLPTRYLSTKEAESVRTPARAVGMATCSGWCADMHGPKPQHLV